MTVTSGSVKKIAFLAVLVILIVLFIAGYFVMNSPRDSMESKENTGSKVITSGDQAPEFRLAKFDGGSVTLADLRGRVVMVHFWATWCPPCVEELPTLDRLHQSVIGKDFEMLAVDEDEGGAEAIASFVKKNRLKLPVLFDSGSEVARRYGTYKLPETYIIDRQGVVRYKAIGPRDWTDPANIEVLRNVIAAQ